MALDSSCYYFECKVECNVVDKTFDLALITDAWVDPDGRCFHLYFKSDNSHNPREEEVGWHLLSGKP